MMQQYKKIPNSWKYIRRFDEPSKVLSEKAINILSVAMYQINKHGHAILTHKVLKDITIRKHDQNRRLLKQLGFVFNFKFSRFLTEGNKKYNDAYQITLKDSALEILENPEEYFTNYINNQYFEVNISPIIRVNDKLTVTPSSKWVNKIDDVGFAGYFDGIPKYGVRDLQVIKMPHGSEVT